MILLDDVRPYMVEWRRVHLDIPDSLGKNDSVFARVV
ncbi:MAG: hypothetical protein QOH34_2226 [Mycobacterium sp.]|jgi:hypothetical protein|nr:hypothetical protein [Mycobacterium sp.]